eukprot:TRINITY_DN624_c0_g1_i7.p1 TRINITY_DN624_c0_g1~~TRINITY_DN624_c0_g1_i7.p1  ORF type:complete len:105 (+),score=46.03 TRINITY_DN624_c0_g1_i7:79-393(+)
MIRRPPRSTQSRSSAASDVYKRQGINAEYGERCCEQRELNYEHGTRNRPPRRRLLLGHAGPDPQAPGRHHNPRWLYRRHGPQPCLLYTSPSPRDRTRSRMPSSA